MKKRILASLLAAMMAVSCFTACSSSSSDDTTSNGDSTSTDTDTDEKVSLTLAVQQTTNVEDWETNYITLMAEEELNLDLSFELYPSDNTDLDSKVALLVSAGTTLPDVFMFTMTDDECYEYGSKGALVSMTDYLADETYTPNFNAIDEEMQSVMIATSTTADGEVYSLPRYNVATWNEGCYRMFVYTPWLETLDAELPTTTDEFYDLCVRMRDEDPNGNGIADEIAIMGSYDGWAQDVTTWIMNAFVYTSPDQYYFAVEDSEVFAAFTTDEWYNGLEYMNNLVNEGLLDTLTFTQDSTSLKAVLGSIDTGAVGFVASGSYSTFKSQEATHWNVALTTPLTGPDGYSSVASNSSTAENCYMITSSCKNIEAAVTLGDYFYIEENGLSARFGVEGEHWSTDPEITSQYYSETYVALGVDTYLAIIDNLWNTTCNYYWGEVGPTYRSQECSSSLGYYLWEEMEEIDQTTLDPNFYQEYYASYVPSFPDEVCSYLPYTDDEVDTITICKTTIDSYVEEQLVAFVTGSRALSDWDTYLAELDAMGLSTYVETNQSAYDRYLTF